MNVHWWCGRSTRSRQARRAGPPQPRDRKTETARLVDMVKADGDNAGQKTDMITRPIPKSGEKLPVIGLGTWQTFDVGNDAAALARLTEVLRLLFDGGGKVIDSSPMY